LDVSLDWALAVISPKWINLILYDYNNHKL